jgi:hypothetical protein
MIDYEDIRRTLNGVWLVGKQMDISSKPTNKMLIPGKGVADLRLVRKIYQQHCVKQGIEPVALNAPEPDAVNHNLFFYD